MRRLIFISVLLIGCGIFLLLWDSPPETFLKSPAINTSEELPKADGYMLVTTTLKYDQQGQPNYRLNTTETRYFKKRDRFEMENPVMVTFNLDDPAQPWNIESRQGEIFESGKKVILTGDVYAWQNTTTSARNEMRSQKLVLFPEKHIAESDKRVIITTPQGRTSGVGLWANLQQERFKLLNNVKGIHRAKP